MIPKVAHFHWAGRTMSWLRACGIVTFKKYHPDWEIRLIGTDPRVRPGLKYPQQADCTWWMNLYERGGWLVATDIVFVRPIPEAWLGEELVAVKNGTRGIYQNALIGCRPGNGFIGWMVERCKHVTNLDDFQAFGPTILQRCDVECFDIPAKVVCPIQWDRTAPLWAPGSEIDTSDEEIIGVHWFGGAPDCREYEAQYDSDMAISRLARREMAT